MILMVLALRVYSDDERQGEKLAKKEESEPQTPAEAEEQEEPDNSKSFAWTCLRVSLYDRNPTLVSSFEFVYPHSKSHDSHGLGSSGLFVHSMW
jgi:hypothetical protein